MQVEYRTALAEVRGDNLEYVISDESKDRHGTVLSSDGWQLANFLKNPIALFNHDPHFVVGSWDDLKVEGQKLIGRLNLLPAGVSQRLDEIRAAAQAKVLRAVSVGFRLLESEGERYTKMELLEVSLVSVPSNPNALAMARSLHLSERAKELIFGESAEIDQTIKPVRLPGESAALPSKSGVSKMNLSQQIEVAQSRLVELRDQKDQHVSAFAEREMDDEAIGALETLNEQITRQQRLVSALVGSEQDTAKKAEPATRTASSALTVSRDRPFAAPAQKVKPTDHLIRAAVVRLLSHVEKRSPVEILRERYEDHPDTRTMYDVVSRAASAPATTSTANWATQLIQTVNAEMLDELVPDSVFARLSALGRRYTFGRNGSITIPSWASTPTVAGGFVLEGAAIPVKQAALASVTLTPKKMAVITTFTREIAEHSTPAIEAMLRQKINSDTSVALDTVLVDATAVSTTRPAGLRNGVAETAASNLATTAFADAKADLVAHIGVLATGSSGNPTRPVIITHPSTALALGLLENAGGDMVFNTVGLQGGAVLGIPVIVSSTATAGTIITVDAAAFASVTGDEPRFDVSDQATLHMEDTTPLAIGTAGAPNTVAAPVRSLFQTDTLGLRMILPMNWAMVRSGLVAWTSSVNWD